MAEQRPVENLVGWAKQGDRGAFEELMAMYRDRLLTSLEIRFRGEEDRMAHPDDLLNETMLRAYESLDRFEWQGEDSFLRWLYGICRNVQHEASRKKRFILSLDSAKRATTQDPTPSRALRREERFERLKRAIAALPSQYREVIQLSRMEGLKTRKVAERLGKTADSVKHLLARGIELLRQDFGDTESYHLPDRTLDDEGK